MAARLQGIANRLGDFLVARGVADEDQRAHDRQSRVNPKPSQTTRAAAPDQVGAPLEDTAVGRISKNEGPKPRSWEDYSGHFSGLQNGTCLLRQERISPQNAAAAA
jgi:hypothetical protein